MSLLDGRTPLTVRRLVYVGTGAPAFERAYAARNPAAAFVSDTPDGVVIADLDSLSLEDLKTHAQALAADGVLVAASRSGAHVAAALEALGDTFRIAKLQALIPGDDHFDDFAPRLAPAQLPQVEDRDLLLVVQKSAAEPAPLPVQIAAFAPRLMDIRTRLPAHALRSEPELTVAYGGAPFTFLPLGPESPKILVLQRPLLPSAKAWCVAMADAVRRGWPVVMEIDDHPAMIAAVAGRKLAPDDWLTYGFTHALQTSTERLGRAFSKYNPAVKVFPNAVFDLPPLPPAPAPRRVFYGALSRGKFAARVAASLAPVTEEFPEVEYVVVGDRAVFDALPTANKSFHDYMPYEAYLDLMATCAVSLSPVEGRLYEDTKSDAKFLDAAARGVVTLASPTIYAETIVHGQTGLIAHRLKDWAPRLAEALRDEPARQVMARQAWDYVRDHRMFAHQAAARSAWYRELWERREELTAGVIGRLPGLAQALA
ncbi:MAG: glycosyltransferase [Phenylobacterium sp.]|uniref:glycosyltransferase family protein n=1 Tax=Phenylobacterium sp. TaxID=1871053 RepID=UPI001B57D7BF|nr:glycosyltransferase [Phenylobacterium sp.]MBP7815681.1 glycosyltransferase [Phenylobacterium sp.]MBP9232483.1 glycosyltransferase [Phenylobacterium sp.]MBP9755536.1 glycosyltransferase [Phenylobacterium sp.]